MYSDEYERLFKDKKPTNPDFNHYQLFRTLLKGRRRKGIPYKKKRKTDLVTIFRIEYHGVETFQAVKTAGAVYISPLHVSNIRPCTSDIQHAPSSAL